MGKRGPPKKPTALKIIAGNPGHRPLNLNEPQPEVGMPPIPEELDADGLKIWHEVAPELYATGVLTVIDGAALAAFCTAYSVWIKAERRLKIQARNDDNTTAEGLLVKSKTGGLVQNPLLGVANVARRDMVRIAGELGLTPASRANLEGRKRDEDPTDKKFFATG
jgi:P27 family predicted phage terminase small subunit